jgi:serine protease AprX
VTPTDPADRRFGWLLSAVAIASAGAAMFILAQSMAKGDALAAKGDAFVLRKVAGGSSSGWTGVVVRLENALTEVENNQIRSLGGDIYRHLPVVQSVAVRVPTRNLAKLASLPFVKRVSADVTVRKNDEFTVESSGADLVYQYSSLSGNGVGVAVVDSGVHRHKDLDGSTRVVCTKDFVSAEPIMKYDEETHTWIRVYDPCGHGTHVAGIVAGNGKASDGSRYTRTFYGIARKAKIVDVRVLDDQGMGSVSNAIAGIQWVIANKAKYNIRVLNLSLGHPVGESYTTDPLCQAVEAAWKSGIVVICAAGNTGRQNDTATAGVDNEGYGTAYGSIQSPGNDPFVITVGAMKSMDGTRAHDRIATYSSRGPSRLDMVLKPDIVAPGNRVISLAASKTYLGEKFDNTNMVPFSYYAKNARNVKESNKYFKLSGTSMAAPVVAGAAALMLELNPNLSPDTVKTRLMLSATKWVNASGISDPCTYGAGYLNIPWALMSRHVATQYALSPHLYREDNGAVKVAIDSTIWGEKLLWGTGVGDFRAAYGPFSMYDDNAIWGTADTLMISGAIWGQSVWADRAVWGAQSGCVDLTSIAINGE